MVTEVKGAPLSGGIVAPPMGIGADPEALAKYTQAIDAQLKALENRSGNIPWFKISAALADPGRTGSAAEGFGRAMGVIGQQQEEEQKNALPIAQMRAQLAGQKYELGNKTQAYNMLANIMGFKTPTEASNALRSGEGIIGLGSKFTPEFFTAMSLLDPKIAATVKDAATMDTDRRKLIIDSLKAGVDVAKLNRDYGAAAVANAFNYAGVSQPSATGAPASNPNLSSGPARPEEPLPAGAVPGIDGDRTPKTPEDTEDQRGRGNTPPASTPASENTEAPVEFGYRQLSNGTYQSRFNNNIFKPAPGASEKEIQEQIAKLTESQQNIYKANLEALDKPYLEETAKLKNFDNIKTVQNLNRTDGILKILTANPEITGLLQNAKDNDSFQRMLNGFLASAQEGIKLGNFGSISIPVEKYLQTANLTKNQRLAVTELTRLIGQEFLASMGTNRGLLGVNPTDNDARLFQAAQAGTPNLAANIYSWAQGRAAEYEVMNDIYKGHQQYETKTGRGKDPSGFFRQPAGAYYEATQKYSKLLDTIMQNSPGFK
jgi:hypothetical protein